jgi:hypothetical protein
VTYALGMYANGKDEIANTTARYLRKTFPERESLPLLDNARYQVDCPKCHGIGQITSTCKVCNGTVVCHWCKGSGRLEQPDGMHECGFCFGSGKCGLCKGTGQEVAQCWDCSGSGHIVSRQLMTTAFMKNVEDLQSLAFVKEQKEKGLIEFEGRWITSKEKEQEIARRSAIAKAQQADAERKLTEEKRKQTEAEHKIAENRRQEAVAEEGRKQAELKLAEQKRLQAEAEARGKQAEVELAERKRLQAEAEARSKQAEVELKLAEQKRQQTELERQESLQQSQMREKQAQESEKDDYAQRNIQGRHYIRVSPYIDKPPIHSETDDSVRKTQNILRSYGISEDESRIRQALEAVQGTGVSDDQWLAAYIVMRKNGSSHNEAVEGLTTLNSLFEAVPK